MLRDGRLFVSEYMRTTSTLRSEKDCIVHLIFIFTLRPNFPDAALGSFVLRPFLILRTLCRLEKLS